MSIFADSSKLFGSYLFSLNLSFSANISVTSFLSDFLLFTFCILGTAVVIPFDIVPSHQFGYLKGRKVRVYKFSWKQNFARINFRDWRFQLFRGNLFSRISRMKKFLCISRGEIFANFASRRFFKLWRKLIFELRLCHIRPRRGHISFWSSYHTITSSECTYHQWPPILGITFNNI